MGFWQRKLSMARDDYYLFLTPEWLKNDKVLLNNNFEMVWGSFQQLKGTVWF